MTREILTANVSAAAKALQEANQALDAFNQAPENNVFPDLDTALAKMEDALYGRAQDACEGRHCFGLDKYEQGFFVGETEYLATMTFEYNRHDKTYYYVDDSEFSYAKVE